MRPVRASAAASASYPATPPAPICGNTSLLAGPATAPTNAVTVPKGDDTGFNWNRPGTTFWFESGIHTLGRDQYNQIQPPASSTFLGAPGAILDGQGVNRYALTQTATNVTIRYLTIQNFVPGVDSGVVNHDSGAGWTIQYNTVAGNGGAGVMVGPGNVVSYNCLQGNGQYGFNAVHNGGNYNITIDHNEITANNTGNWEVQIPGCGCAGAGKVWNTINGSITNNWIHNNSGPGIWVDTDNAGILIDGNYIADNDSEGIIYELSYNAQITNNYLVHNGIVKGKSFAPSSTFPVAAIYVSNSGGDSRIDNGLFSTFTIANNDLVDNWGGVTLWEDANRFCGSDPNTVYCTLGNPLVTLATCVPGTINVGPSFSDCRWQTKNVSIHDNQFNFSRATVGCTTVGCGEQAIVANPGTSPSWSPYLGTGIDTAITTQQNNHFAHNAYTGDWQFDWFSADPMTFTQWQGGPYNQDTGSSLNGVTTAPPPPGNLIDADTATLEGSIGHWATWFSATVAQTTAQAQSGTHSLQVNITAPNGWGVQLNNWLGFTAAPGPQTISFWGLAGHGAVGADMRVQWRDTAGNVIATNDVAINALTSTWQQGSANMTAPVGTATVSVIFYGPPGGTGLAGDVVYLDQIMVGAPSSSPTAPGNLLDSDTATLEGSVGHWAPWFSSSVAQSTAQAQSGSHSLQVSINALYGWGVQVNLSPGFAAAAGPQTISFWGLAGHGAVGATMQAQWRDGGGNLLGTTSAPLATLTSTWQQATAGGVAPAGTTNVTVIMFGAGSPGDSLYLDQIFVGPAAPSGTNILDADTASMEAATGHWEPWFSCSLAQSAAHAERGTHSLQVNINALFGWGVQLNNWPGFTTGAGPRTIRFWALAGSAALGVTMQVQWRDGAGNVVANAAASIPVLTGAWQVASATAAAPASTASVTVTFNGLTGGPGDNLYLDDIYVGT